MKKIAFVVKMFQDSSFHGGGEKLFFKLIEKFIKKQYLVDIYCSESNVLTFEGINSIIVMQNPYNHVDPVVMETFYDEVKTAVLDKNYDLVISENITPPVGVTFLQGHSLIHRQRKLKSIFESLFYNFRSEKKTRIKYQDKWLKQGYKKIFVVSDIHKKDIIDNFNTPAENISVIYPGVDIPENILKPKNYTNDSVLTFGLSAPGFKIKGGYILLKALKLIKNKGYDFNAKIIYPKAKKNFGVKLLLKLYKIEKNVEFVNFQKNMQDFYNSVDCMVMPSYEDTFNLVTLEAMANKKICIVSSNCGASEIIDDGENGFVFSMRNPEKNLAEKMMIVLNNKTLINKMSENAFLTANKFSWDKTFTEFENELENMYSKI
ncbi:MAG: glycosyltransferase family 4 protein [bacterium]